MANHHISQRRARSAAWLAGLCLASSAATAATSFQIVFDDPAASWGSYYADIERGLLAAGDDWVTRFGGGADTTLVVQVGFAAISTANGASAWSSFVGWDGAGVPIYEQGAAAKLKTGIDGNGGAADIVVNLGATGYLQQTLWFDPDPAAQLVPVPNDRIDARSVFLHELGHAFGFNGWMDGFNGAQPGYMSTFDQLVSTGAGPSGSTLYFNGAQAMAVYGGPVPLTYGNFAHIGNGDGRDGADLLGDLMNGVAYSYGTRYSISSLDLAIMADVGLPMATVLAVPEPETWALWLLGAPALWVVGRRRVRR